MIFLDEQTEADIHTGGNFHGNSYTSSLESAAVLPFVDNAWNYEAEKSYWFELSGRKDKLQELVDNGLQNIQFKDSPGASLAADGTLGSIKDVKNEQSAEFPPSDTLAFENVDDKLQQMLQ